MPAIRMAIVEDQRDIREGLQSLIEETEGFSCTGSYRSMEDALPALRINPPDACLIDIGLPGISGIEGVRILHECNPSIVLLVLTVFEDDDRIFNAICAGANGYLLKRTAPPRLFEAVREAMDGGAPMSPEIARRVLELFRKFRPQTMVPHALTPHEIRLLGLMVKGHSYKSAAHELGVSVNTVSFHLRSIYGKLEVHSKSEAVARALRDHLIR